MKSDQPAKSYSALLLLVASALGCLLLLPVIVRGTPDGYDFQFHINSWLEVSRALAQTHNYPQWAEGANYGLGEPRFIFYPPVSIVFGTALTDILPLRMAPGAFLFFTGALAAVSMWKLAANFVGPRWAIFASALYVLNPYFLLCAYTRASYAELLLAAFAPLLFLALFRTLEGSWRWTATLAVGYGAAWMTNLPGAVLISYAIALLAVITTTSNRSWRPLLRVAIGLALGFGIAASFIGPVLQLRPTVQSESVIDCPSCVQDNFLFTSARQQEPEAAEFNRRISITLVAEIVLAFLVLAGLVLRKNFSDRRVFALGALLILSAFLFFSPSLVLWRYLPELHFVQFPWRAAFLFNTALVVLIVAAIRTLRSAYCYALVAVLFIAAILIPWLWIPRWEPANFSSLSSEFRNDGYEGVLEYAPAQVEQLPERMKGLPRVLIGDCTDNLQVRDTVAGPEYACEGLSAVATRWDARVRELQITASNATTLSMLQYWYPTWSATVNDAPATVEPQTDGSPYLRINVPAGRSVVRLEDQTPSSKKLSRILSAFCLLVAVIIFARDRHRQSMATNA